MSLASTPLGKSVRVTGMQTDSAQSIRLMELGIIEGAEICVVRRAPLGDPLQVRLGDYDLSLRSSDAARIEVA
ncbi:MAG: ferrous iron transport protein A [Phycisphaerales bacterium]|nr:ferrous iron transport protein A [Phycisphaerales bacterium]